LNVDPHFHTWDNIFYDYHGRCDLVLIKNDLKGIHLHIRTEPQGGYASISHAALKLGGDTLEINMDHQSHFFLNNQQVNSVPSTAVFVGSYPLTITPVYGTRFQVDIGPAQFIRITRYQFGLDIIVQANGANFSGSEGLCGSWNFGGLLDRDGDSFTNADWYQNWQVKVAENLFTGAGHSSICTPAPQGDCSKDFPNGNFPCSGKDGGDRVHDEERAVHDEELLAKATEAAVLDGNHALRNLEHDCDRTCGDIPAKFPEHRTSCIFDVIVTGNNDFACTPAYIDPIVIRQDTCRLPPDPESLSQRVCKNFAVHARTAVTFAGVITTIQGGDVGVSPGTSITGAYQTNDGVVGVVWGTNSDGFAGSVTAAHNDAIAPHNDEGPLMAIEIGGQTFTPGTHRSGSAINIAYNTEVTLNGTGEYLFIAGTTLVTAAKTKIILTNGAKAKNVLWALGTAATLGANSVLEGSILAGTAITFGTHSKLNGCALAQSAVTFESEGYVCMGDACNVGDLDFFGRHLRG
jgi:hypothetical protein